MVFFSSSLHETEDLLLEEVGKVANLDFVNGNWDTSIGVKGSKLSGGQVKKITFKNKKIHLKKTT